LGGPLKGLFPALLFKNFQIFSNYQEYAGPEAKISKLGMIKKNRKPFFGKFSFSPFPGGKFRKLCQGGFSAGKTRWRNEKIRKNFLNFQGFSLKIFY